MDMIEDFVEDAAIAVCQRDCPEIEGVGLVWKMSANQDNYRHVARAVIKSYRCQLEEAGFKTLPVEPTEAMVLAVTDEWGWDVPIAFWKDMIAAYTGE